ncbi:MAG: CCA tRNA nucleotidyltransferase, partial [bacterium]|nr:CCA tRNA nucleotidyltransferase [bacterium]
MLATTPAWLDALASQFSESGHQLYLVGGAVRNELLGLTVGEWDLATDAKPSAVEQILRQKTKKIGLIGKRFGTVTAELDGHQVEITTFRGESYEEHSRQPTVEFGRSIDEDLSRRDFTVNAIAYDLRFKRLLDPHQGTADLEAKIIRAVGDPITRFREDPLRMLRAIRFAVTLDFVIEPATFEAISLERERFAILSAERVAQELDKILLSTTPSRGI